MTIIFAARMWRSHPEGTRFDVSTEQGSYPNLSLRLLGRHQAYNAALAIGAAEKILGVSMWIGSPMFSEPHLAGKAGNH